MSKMKISKLEIYTIEEIQSFLESNIVLDLPVVVQDKIADFYMNDTSKEYNLNWPNKISRRKDFKTVCYLKRYMSDQFISLPTNDIQSMRLIKSLMCHKFPKADFNFDLFDPDYWRKTIDSLIKKILQANTSAKRKAMHDDEYIEKIKNNLIIAGGIFTNYSSKSFYSTKFHSAREYFLKKRDVDIFSNNNELFQFESCIETKVASSYSSKIYTIFLQITETYKNESYKLNFDVNVDNLLPCIFNFVRYSIDQTPTQMVKLFDYDFCKIFYDYNKNKLFIHSSLIFTNLKNNCLKYSHSTSPDILSRRRTRRLKYSLKGFYDSESE